MPPHRYATTSLRERLRPGGTARALRERGLAAVKVVRGGLPTSLIDRLIEDAWLTMRDVDRLVVSRRTLSHRRQHRRALSPEESDRLARVVRVLLLAEETFGGAEKASAWLRRPNRSFGGDPPLELLDTGGGARAVELALGRLAHGVYV